MSPRASSNLSIVGSTPAVTDNAEDLFAEIAEFRSAIVEAWQTRAVIFVEEEQQRLLEEIKFTSKLLEDLILTA